MATTIESMTGISINSQYFSNKTELVLFPKYSNPPKVNRVALLYGKNGSGKSTIAQGFREYKNSINPRTVTVKPLNVNSEIHLSTPGKPEKFFIFDEEYISTRVKIKNSGLDAIVLFGQQVSLEEQIDEVESKIAKITTEKNAQALKCDQFNANNEVISPEYWLTKIRSALRENDGWADIGKRIKGQNQRLQVNDDVIEKIGKLTPEKTKDDLLSEFTPVYEQYSSVDADTEILNQEVIQIQSIEKNVQNSEILLKKEVDKPQLTTREQELLDLFSLTGITEAKLFLSNPQNKICDKCLHTISDDYRNEMLKRIDCILNREVEEFKKELVLLQISEIPLDKYQEYLRLPSYNDLSSKIEKYNKSVVDHNTLIQAKIDNPFNPLVYDKSIEIIESSNLLNSALAVLEKERTEFNRIVQKRQEVAEELLILNDKIAHYDIEEMFATLQTCQEAKRAADDKLEALLKDLLYLQSEKNKLNSERKSYNIAADEINKSLKYIFFSDKRLTIELGADHLYHLKSNGISVNPNKVSCGERNVLALCYYFTEIAKDMDVESKYSEEEFLIIDDPISSFDVENRIGILSFLRWKLEQVLDGCKTTKILLMTHDVGVVYDLAKALGEISVHCTLHSSHAEYMIFELGDKRLTDFKLKCHNEYTHLLQLTYEYAKSTNVDNELDFIIGNVIRRALEAFSTFSYKKGINEVHSDDIILELLDDEKAKVYFSNLMFRLVLHNESHNEYKMKGEPEMSFFSYMSTSEKQRTAKDVLCFIYLLNKTHLLCHLPDAEENLELWSSNIGL